MNAQKNDIVASLREQCEQCEHPNNDNMSTCSHLQSSTENSGNLITKIEKPAETPPKQLVTPEVNRPCYLSHSDWFQSQGKPLKPGLYYHDEKQDENGNTTHHDIWIGQPLTVEAITSSEHHDEFGRLLKFVDSNQNIHEWAMPMHMLKGSGEELRGELLNQGYTFETCKRSHLANYIMAVKPKHQITAATTIGWHENTFILPKQIIGTGTFAFQSECASENDFIEKGSIESWGKEVGSLCAENIPLMISVAAALSGPLLKLAHFQHGGGIHWVGDSSIGKTTAVEVAATIWGPPEFIRSWSATSNGIEGTAATRNDTCLILDEIDEASPKEVGKISYMLINGCGKQRANRKGMARKTQRWRLMALSTGERSLESIIQQTGNRVNSGQLVRLLNIPAKFNYGIFNDLHGFESGRSLADHLKTACQNHYGMVGPAFVNALLSESENIPDLLESIVSKFSQNASSSLEQRAARIFSLIGLAGELAIKYKLLPWDKGSSLSAALVAFTHWQSFQGSKQTEDERILQAVRDFLEKYSDSRFSAIKPENENERSILNRAGWYKDTNNGRIYMINSASISEVGGGYDRSRVVEAFVRSNWIHERDSKRHTKKVRTPSGLKNLYHISIPEDANNID